MERDDHIRDSGMRSDETTTPRATELRTSSKVAARIRIRLDATGLNIYFGNNIPKKWVDVSWLEEDMRVVE
jgi:hypothetical protein